MKAGHALLLESRSALAEALSSALHEAGASGIWEESPRRWKAYFDEPVAGLEERLAAEHPLSARWVTEAQVDWAARYQQGLKPMPVGRLFAVLPSESLSNPWPGRTAIKLVPGTAFGTGEHFTTASCLHALEGLRPFPQEVLDVGCGSGILAVAARKLGAPRVAACDTDPEAVLATAAAAAINEISIEIVHGGAGLVRGEFGCVVANILAETLVETMPALAAKVGRDGKLLLSGILLEKRRWVLEAASFQGFEMIEFRTDGLWATLLLSHFG